MRREPKDLAKLHGGWYVRISLDESQQEAKSQRENIQRWLGNHGLSVPSRCRWEDTKGYTPRDLPEQRPAFQEVLKAVRSGLIKWLVVDSQVRFGGKDPWHYASMIHTFREHGVQVWTTDDEELTADDALAYFQGGFRAESSKQEQLRKAHDVIRGKKSKAKAGEYHGGYVPYGLDVVCFKAGKEKWRLRWFAHFVRRRIYPDGRTEDFNGKGNMPAVEVDEVLKLQPGDTERIKVVKWLFEIFATQAISTYHLAKLLNLRKIKPTYNKTWLGSHVMSLLKNTAYIGLPAWNKQGGGRFLEDDGEAIRPVVSRRGRRERPKTAWVLPDEPVFAPIIDRTTWDKVQAKMDGPKKSRAPKTADLWLAGLVHCANCRVRMRGQKRPNYSQFLCQTGDRRKYGRDDVQCMRNTVHHELIEESVKQYLTEAGVTLDTFLAAHRTADLGLLETLEGDFHQCLQVWLSSSLRMAEFVQAHGTEDEQADLGTQLAMFGPDDVAYQSRLTALYKQSQNRSAEGIRAELTALEGDHNRLMKDIERFQGTPRALQKKQAELSALEDKMTALEGQLTDYAAEAEGHWAAIKETVEAVKHARRTFTGHTNERAKAEAVRQVIERIDVFFEPTGKKYPQSLPTAIEITGVGGRKVRYAALSCKGRSPPAPRSCGWRPAPAA